MDKAEADLLTEVKKLLSTARWKLTKLLSKATRENYEQIKIAEEKIIEAHTAVVLMLEKPHLR
jgi:hypothetical protein